MLKVFDGLEKATTRIAFIDSKTRLPSLDDLPATNIQSIADKDCRKFNLANYLKQESFLLNWEYTKRNRWACRIVAAFVSEQG
jgi:hypothetical protein